MSRKTTKTNNDEALTSKVIISAINLRWIAKSVANHNARPILQNAQVAFKDGRAWIVSTDTHRLHVAQCRIVGKTKHEPFLINVQRALHELRYYRGESLQVDLDSRVCTVIGKKENELGPAMGVLEQVNEGIFPAFERVVPRDRPTSLAPTFSVNQKYWRDATERSKDTANRICWWCREPSRPIVISHRLNFDPFCGELEWFAVVMPMALDNAQGLLNTDVATLESLWAEPEKAA